MASDRIKPFCNPKTGVQDDTCFIHLVVAIMGGRGAVFALWHSQVWISRALRVRILLQVFSRY